MRKDTRKRIEETGLIPVVVIDDVADAVPVANALKAGGLHVMEIALRTEAGLDSIEAVAKEVPEILIGAGTVLSLDKAIEAMERGARYIVSPGFDVSIVTWCLDHSIAVFPGCVTPTEITAAIGMGLDVVKFFPANLYGGTEAIKELSGPFPNVKFIPTGGIDLSNLKDFLVPQVFAVGGGWLCPRKDILEKNFDNITAACVKSLDIVKAG